MEKNLSSDKTSNKADLPVKIAITGAPGSGKSTAGTFFRKQGFVVIDTDELARKAVEPGSPCLNALTQLLGESILTNDNSLDRKKLFEAILADTTIKKQVEAIIHPEIFRLLRQEIESAKAGKQKIVIVEVPLLFEAGWECFFDYTVAIYATNLKCMENLVQARGLDEKTAKNMISAQFSGEKKAGLADYVINNTGNLAEFMKELGLFTEHLIVSMCVY